MTEHAPSAVTESADASPLSLTVIIPVFNEESEIGQTIGALEAAIAKTSFRADVVLVDDGSTDGTCAAARAAAGGVPLRVIEQKNSGRFEARKRGLAEASGTYCFLLDSRVRVDPTALRFVEEQLGHGEATEVWNGHVDIETGGSPYGVFWDVVTRRVFWAYFGSPRTTSFGLRDYERFPKGTGCFLAPRQLLNDAVAAFESSYEDLRYASDDTPLIRWLAARRPINISPGFSCRYAPRQRLKPFLRHALHRGTVFVDSHGRRDSRWLPLVVGFFVFTPAWLVCAGWMPLIGLVPFVAASAAGAALALTERRLRDAATMAWVTPLYATLHGIGMWRGLALMALRSRPGRHA